MGLLQKNVPSWLKECLIPKWQFMGLKNYKKGLLLAQPERGPSLDLKLESIKASQPLKGLAQKDHTKRKKLEL